MGIKAENANDREAELRAVGMNVLQQADTLRCTGQATYQPAQTLPKVLKSPNTMALWTHGVALPLVRTIGELVYTVDEKLCYL